MFLDFAGGVNTSNQNISHFLFVVKLCVRKRKKRREKKERKRRGEKDRKRRKKEGGKDR